MHRATRGGRAGAARWPPAEQDPETAGPERRRRCPTRRCTASRSPSSASARRPPTIPVADGEPGEEVHSRHGLDDVARARRARPSSQVPRVDLHAASSRYRFVYPSSRRRPRRAIEACEAAWEFFGGVFRVVIPDNTKAIVHDRRSASSRASSTTFLEYAQARGFHIDPTRRAAPQGQGAASSAAVRDVRDDCFAGENLRRISTTPASTPSAGAGDEYGMRRHSRTQRLPREHFEADEQPAPAAGSDRAYDIPLWSEPKVAARPARAGRAARCTRCRPRTCGARCTARARSAAPSGSTIRPCIGQDASAAAARRPLDRPAGLPGRERGLRPARRPRPAAPGARSHGAAIGRFAAAVLDARCPGRACAASMRCSASIARYGAARVDDDVRDGARRRHARRPPARADARARRLAPAAAGAGTRRSRSAATCAPPLNTPFRRCVRAGHRKEKTR